MLDRTKAEWKMSVKPQLENTDMKNKWRIVTVIHDYQQHTTGRDEHCIQQENIMC